MTYFLSNESMFVYKNYFGKIQIGTDFDDYHNGIKDEFLHNITDLIIPSYYNGTKVIKIGYRSFSRLPNLLSAFIPNSIKEIRGDIFLECYNLNNVVFEDNSKVEYIELYAFYYTNITQITIPSSVKTIYRKAFASCYKLQTVVFIGITTTDDSNIFENCTESLRVLVPLNYPHQTFGGRNVIKTISSFNGNQNPSHFHRALTNIISLNILLYISILSN